MTFLIWIPSTNNIIHRSAVRSAVTSENWNIRADESLHKSPDSNTNNGETSQSDTPSPVQEKGFDLIQQERHMLQMGRNLFVKEAVPTSGDKSFIHRKGEESAKASKPFPEIEYFQEDIIDVQPIRRMKSRNIGSRMMADS